MFDMDSPTRVTVQLKNGTASSAKVLPSSANITPHISSQTEITLTIDRPRQVCLIVNNNMNKPLCLFADPRETNVPTGSSKDLIYFGPGTHHVIGHNITVGADQSVYLAGGAHVYGQVVAPEDAACDRVKVFGRGVLDGHDIPIDHRAPAMIELPRCRDIVVEGITTIDSPQYQIKSYYPGGTIRFAKAIAWGFSTDGWSAGEYSLVEDSFNKVNDDSHKIYSTGSVVQRVVVWQMENGCPFMMSYNLNENVGFMTVRDSDVIAHERTGHFYNPDGIICAVHGGSGNLNDYFFDDIRIESQQWALMSINILNNPWGKAATLGEWAPSAVSAASVPDPYVA
jgi:hypothetical protein